MFTKKNKKAKRISKKKKEHSFDYIKNSLIRLFDIWLEFSKENNISYSLMDGSLLGQKRSEKIITNDNDIDIVIDLDGYNKLLNLRTKYPNFIILNSEIKKKVTKPQIILSNRFSKLRYDCNGNETNTQVDSCSFNGPLARLTDKNYHIDILGFNRNIFKLSKDLNYLYNRDNIERFDNILIDCKFENRKCKCFKDELSHNFLVNIYGYKYLIPDSKNSCFYLKTGKKFDNRYHELCGKNY